VKSFLRTYGSYLGLDTRQLIDDFKRQYEAPSDHELRPIAPLGRDRDRDRGPRRPRIPPWVTVVAVLVVVVAVLAYVGSQGQNKTGTTPPSHPATTKAKPKTPRRRRPPPPTHVKLQLVPTGQVYVCLVDGTGKKLIPGLIFSPGQTIPAKSASKLLLTLGNNNVQLKANGVTIPVAASSGSIGYEFQGRSHHVLTAAQQPRCA
jgi:cytoskeletal protein RodZ